jgi:hypothetical protein
MSEWTFAEGQIMELRWVSWAKALEICFGIREVACNTEQSKVFPTSRSTNLTAARDSPFLSALFGRINPLELAIGDVEKL